MTPLNMTPLKKDVVPLGELNRAAIRRRLRKIAAERRSAAIRRTARKPSQRHSG